MKKNIIVVSLVGITEIITFLRWSSCWLFQNNFYFTFQTLTTQVLIDSNEEKGLPIFLIRLLHNKITGFLWGVSQTFLQYIDIRFLMAFIGILGAIGVYLGFWYLLTRQNKNKALWGLMILLFALSFVEMFFIPHIDFSKRIMPLVVVLESFSLFGIWEFIQRGNKKIRIGIVSILIVISIISLILFPHDLFTFCVKV